MHGYSPFSCRIVNDIETIVWARSGSAALRFGDRIIEVADFAASKWLPIVHCVRHGITVPVYEKWLTSFKQQYVFLGGKTRAWPKTGVPPYDKASTDERWAVIEACGWWPTDSDPLSLVDAQYEDVLDIARLLKGLDFPDVVLDEMITYAGYFYSWRHHVSDRNPALVQFFDSLGLIERGSVSTAPAFFLSLVPFKYLREYCTKIGIKPARSINGTIEQILSAETSDRELDLLVEKHVQASNFEWISLPESIVQRQLISARAYARGLVCFMLDAVFNEANAIRHLSTTRSSNSCAHGG